MGNAQESNQDIFDRDDEDFENQLDSTKGLRAMIQSKHANQEDLEIQALLEQAENQDRDSGDLIGPGEDFNNSEEDFIKDFEELDRDPENEEVYDYFLEMNKEENQNEN